MKKTIIRDKQGVMIWENPQDKLNFIKDKLTPTLENIKSKFDFNEMKEFPRKINFNTLITTNLLNLLSVYDNIPYNDAVLIQIDTLKEYTMAFRLLVSYIIGYYEQYIATKEQFCAFAGIGYSAYNYLLANGNNEILVEMERLEGFFGELQFAASQSGLYKEKTTENKLRAMGVGHSMDMKPNLSSITINQTMKLDNDSIDKQLKQLLGNNFNKKG